MKLLLRCLPLLCLVSPILAMSAEPPIGYIRSISQEALIVRGNLQIPARLDQPVYQGDQLLTRYQAGLGVVFEDGGVLTLGPSTLCDIDQYLFRPESQQAAFVSYLRRGSVAFLGGAISRIAPEATRILTPSGTLALNEAKILVRVE